MNWVSSAQSGGGGGPIATRVTAAAVLLGCLGLLGVAAWLQPAEAGLGTHTQLGLAGCAWRADQGAVCPSCGMTTAFSLAADGRLGAAFVAQPAAALLAVLVAAAAWVAVGVLWSGSTAGLRLAWRTWAPRRAALVGAAVLIVGLGWVYKLIVT